MSHVLWNVRLLDLEPGVATERRALGYDSGPPGASANELLRLVEAGLSPIEALCAATIGGAAALGRADLGRTAVGAPADRLVVDGRPDEDLALLTRPSSIIQCGAPGSSSRSRDQSASSSRWRIASA